MADVLQTFSGAGFKVSFIGLLFACFLHIVGFATEYWSSSKDGLFNMGLWRGCRCIVESGTCECTHLPDDVLKAWVKAVRAMETLGLISIVFAICGSVWILIRHQGNSIKMIPIFLIGGAGIQILIGVAVYGAKLHDFDGLSINYSFGLCCISGSICIILSLLMSYAYSKMCRCSGDDTTVTLTATDAIISDLPATIEQAGYDQPGNDLLRYEQPRIGRPRSQLREDTQWPQRTQYTPGGFLAGLPSRGIDSPPAYTCTPGDDYMRDQHIPVIANTQNVPEGDIITQPSNLTENQQRTPQKEPRLADRPPRMADTHSDVDTTGQFDGTADTHDC